MPIRTIPHIVPLALLLLAGCSDGGPSNPVTLQLADLVRFAPQYDGQWVRTTGTVRTHPDPRHYWIEANERTRVAVEPNPEVAPWSGQTVQVIGRFEYSGETGRRIQAETIQAVVP